MTPGQMLDRLTVLELKIHKGREAGLCVEHHDDERAVLCAATHDLDAVAALDALRRIHARIWEITDRVFKTPDEVGREELLEAFRLNRERSEVVESVDRAAGAWKGWEKLL
jgi:hypothetical protein